MSDILPPGWLTREQAQELTGYSEDHLTRLARAGKVTALKLAGQVWLFEREGLLKYHAEARPGPKGKG
jgi:excisionase family DNA binding protein